MPPKQKPQPQLHVPVLKFPLSSPISEEIESPPCSSAEDHEGEHNRPFAFLSKATRQKIEHKGGKDGTGNATRSPTFPQISKANIRGITKKRKSVAKPLGLNLVTDFTLAPAPKKRGTVEETEAAPFVDLNDLKLLSKVRERERTAQKSKETFKKRVSRGFQLVPDEQTKEHTQDGGSFLNQQLDPADPFHDRHEHGLSPSDRNVMIGLTVPTSESMDRARELDDQYTPLTPSIIVTPAGEEAPWSHSKSSTEQLRPPRVASSVYSQPTPRLWQFESDVPPVPAIPAQHYAKAKGSGGSYPNTNLTINSKPRPASITSTVWEDDSPRGQSPPTTAASSTTDLNPINTIDNINNINTSTTSPQNKNTTNNPFTNTTRLSVNTETDRPTSHGWWTYLLSPLLGRSGKSPLSPSFPQNLNQNGDSPTPSTPSPTTTRKSRWWREKERYREKEISCFSPDTPETAAPIGEKNFEQIRGIDTNTNTRGQQSFPDLLPDNDPAPTYEYATATAPVPEPAPAPRQHTMSYMFGGGPSIQGEAAEYYQACAHELFSKTPYFECIGHVCSITPADVVGGTRDLPGHGVGHGLAIISVDDSNHAGPGTGFTPDLARNSTTTAKDPGLLIDIDSPKAKSVAATGVGAASAKEVLIHSPASDTSVDSWDSSVVDVHEKGAVAEQATREVPAVVEHQPSTPAPVPAPIPVPVPAAPVENERQILEPPVPAPAPTPAPAPATAVVPMPEPAPAPAPPQIINISPPVVNYPPPPPQPQVQPVQPIIVPQYVPVYPNGQLLQPEQPAPVVQEQPLELSREIQVPPQTGPASQGPSPGAEWPWPYHQEEQAPAQANPAPQEAPRGVEADRQARVPQFSRAPQTTQEQPQGTEWMYEERRHLQAPLVVQGRESGSGWPFSHRQQQQQQLQQEAVPPVPQVPPQGFEWAYGYQGQQNAPVSRGQTEPNGVESVHQWQQAQVETHNSPHTLPQERQQESESPNGERGQPQVLPVAGGQVQEQPALQTQPNGSELAPRQTQESEPISPGFQRAAGGPGSIPLSDMQAPAPAYTQYPRDPPLPPRYDVQPHYAPHAAGGATIVNPGGAIGPYEARRRRLEKEDAAGRKAGGLWRGRGPFSKKGCFGRPGREGRTRRRWYLLIFIFFFIIVILAIVLAITLTKRGDPTPVQSQWLNLTGYPPMPTGIATLAGTEPQVEKSTCITPSSMWSCALPKGQQETNQPYNADQPNFRVSISFRNGTYNNSTTVKSNSASSLRKRSDMFNPSPAAPSNADQAFMGQYTDNNSAPYSGEETPFFMSMLSPISLSSTNLYRRSTDSNSTTFPNLTSVIPAPDENADGSAAAAMLYPLPASQPIKLYNRGQATEHYGFYTYYDKSIYLTSQTQSNPADSTGGTSRANSKYRCTWSQTRFLVQIWTQPDKLGRRLLPSSNATATATSTASTPTSTAKAKSSSSATDFSRPGSFPYPVTITLDRHGGAEKKKLVYCYAIEDDGHYNITAVQLQLEDRAAGGAVVNPAGGIFEGINQVQDANSTEYGGIDGGSGGCQCQYVNWIATA